MMKYTFNKS